MNKYSKNFMKKRKRSEDESEGSSSEDISEGQEDINAVKNKKFESNLKNKGKNKKSDEDDDILVTKDEVTFLVKKITIKIIFLKSQNILFSYFIYFLAQQEEEIECQKIQRSSVG